MEIKRKYVGENRCREVNKSTVTENKNSVFYVSLALTTEQPERTQRCKRARLTRPNTKK